MDERDVQLARERKMPAPDGPPRRAGKKKSTKRWCRGKVGREHQLAIVDGEKFMTPCGPDETSWMTWRRGSRTEPEPPKWWCRHQQVCTACGKILEYFLTAYQCPLWPNIHRGIRIDAELIRWTFEDLGPDPWGWRGILVKESDNWAVIVLPMLVNDRIILVRKPDVMTYEYGWCYDKEPRGAILAAAVWDPDREAEPVAFKKRIMSAITGKPRPKPR